MYWDGTTLINDTHTSDDPANTQTASYLIGSTRHTRTLTGTDITEPAAGTNYYVTDRHGNTTATTNTNSGTTTAYTYTDYGVPTQHVTPGGQPGTGANRNPFQYASEYTTETGNQYLGARTYNPKTTNFTTKDIADQFNLYAYANSNPITLVDPTGQTPNWDTIINGVVLGVTVIAAAITGGLLGAALYAGVSSWLAFGISVTALAADLTSSAIAAAQIHNDREDVSDFISDTDSEILMIAGTVLGLASGLGIGGAAKTGAKKAAAQIAHVPSANTKWDHSILLRETSGAVVAQELTHLDGNDIHKAINAMVSRNEDAGAGGVVFVHKRGEPSRVAIGRLTPGTSAGSFSDAKFGPIPERIFSGSYRQGSDHEKLAKIMGLDVSEVDKGTFGWFSILQRTHISGGQFTWAYPQKGGVGFRVRAYPASGHFAADAPDYFWSPTVRRDFVDFMASRGMRTKMYGHDVFFQDASESAQKAQMASRF
jgi:RHS repeat-associated protein